MTDNEKKEKKQESGLISAHNYNNYNVTLHNIYIYI